MSLNKDMDDIPQFSDFNYENDKEELMYKKRVRELIEDRIEQRLLREDIEDELDDDFDWDDISREL
jgi:hypothetical protein